MKTYLTCPNIAHLVEVEMERDPIDGHILGIERCSAFSPSDWMDCDQECARLLNLRVVNRSRGRGGDR